MWYLKANLVGEAEKLLRHYTLSEDNYIAAWNTIKERYENSRLLVAALINKSLNQPSFATEASSAASIKTMHDTTQEALLGLESLGVSTSTWDTLVLHILLKKLDRNTHALYEQFLSNPKRLPALKDFLAFLEKRFQSLEALGNKGKRSEEPNRRATSSRTSSVTAPVTTTNTKRIACDADHPLYRYSMFLQLTPKTRLNLIRKHHLCPKCLRRFEMQLERLFKVQQEAQYSSA